MLTTQRPSRRSLIAILLTILFLITQTTYAAAAPVVEFSLRATDGRTVSAESLRGKVVVLAFGASWLPLSRAQVQGVQQLANAYGGRGVEVFWVSTDSESQKSKNYASDAQLREFSDKYNLRITVLRDPDGAVSKSMGVDQLPAVVILDKTGSVSGAPVGGLSPNGNLVDLLKGRLDKLL